jgi:hypothetical protein
MTLRNDPFDPRTMYFLEGEFGITLRWGRELTNPEKETVSELIQEARLAGLSGLDLAVQVYTAVPPLWLEDQNHVMILYTIGAEEDAHEMKCSCMILMKPHTPIPPSLKPKVLVRSGTAWRVGFNTFPDGTTEVGFACPHDEGRWACEIREGVISKILGEDSVRIERKPE